MKVKKRWLYFYHFCVIILCLTNSVFLVVNFSDLKIDVHDTSNIMLTVIGFLFAFAAINIYSIFNTNVDKEKENIIDMTHKYEILLDEDRTKMGLTSEMVRLQMIIHSISATQEINSQFLEWIDMANNLASSFVSKLNKIHDNYPKETFDFFYSEMTMVVRNGTYMIEEKLKDIDNDNFWKNHHASIKNTTVKDLSELVNVLQDFEKYDFENKKPYVDQNNNSEDFPKTIGGRVIRVICDFIKKNICDKKV